MGVKKEYYYCWGCGKTFKSLRALHGHLGRCYWYQWYKANGILEAAPFYPDNLETTLEFMHTRNKGCGISPEDD